MSSGERTFVVIATLAAIVWVACFEGQRVNTRYMMRAAKTSAQFEISMPAIDVFWLNHSIYCTMLVHFAIMCPS
jgi:hypothetical protein